MLDLFIGRRELGKTTLAVSISRNFPTRVFFDPRHMLNTTSDILRDGEVSGVLYKMLDTRSEIVIQPEFNVEQTFDEVCFEVIQWLRDNPGEKFCFLVDEARFVPNPDKNKYFDFIVRCTPRSLVTVEMTCHGIVDISPSLRRVADYWILFQLTQESDLDTVRERCGDDVADAVKTLKPYEYIVWNDSIHQWRRHIDRTAWYVPLETRQSAITSRGT
jgi:hypothetical protein